MAGLLWSLVLVQIQAERNDAIREAVNRNDNLAIAFEQYTVRTLDGADAILRYLIREYGRSGKGIDLDRFVVDYTVEGNAVSGVVLADEHGNAITAAYSGRPGGTANVADREHFAVHRSGDGSRAFVGKPVTGRLSGRPLIPLTRRINHADGSFAGVAMALIEPKRFTDVLHEANLRPLDIISLVGLDGITRARLRGTSTSWGEDIGMSPLFSEQARNPAGHYAARGQLDDVPRYFSYRTLSKYGVLVTVGTSEADVLAEFLHRRSRYLWATGLASLVIAAFAFLLMLALKSHRQAAAAALRIEERYRATFEQAAVGMAHADGRGRYLEVNEKFCEILGYPRRELLERTVADVTHPEDLTTSNRLRRQLIEVPGAASSIAREKRYVRKDGTVIWCSITASAVRGEDGSPQYVLGVVQDISDRKRMEEAVRAGEQSFRDLVNILPAAVYVCDAEGKIESYNLRAAELWGREPRINDPEERFCGSLRMTRPDGSDLPHAECPMAVTLRSGVPATNAEIVIERPDGSRRWGLVNATPRRDGQGGLTGAINCIVDITERKQDEERIRQLGDRLMAVQEFERAALSRELHDEFGQVLTAVQLQLRALARQAPSNRLEDCIALVEQLLNQVRSLSLDLRPPQLEERGLAVALESHLARLGRQTLRKISFQCGSDIPTLTGAPAIACFRIVQEAVTNALRHSDAAEIGVALVRDGDFLCLVVRDNGVGFDPESARGKSIEGASAGLLGMENRAASLDGSFEIRSGPGAGTEVRVRIAIGLAAGSPA